MIEFVLGRAGSGKTTYIESKLWQAGKVFYLVPEQASMQKERAMQLRAAEKGRPMPTVITFRRLCDMLMREYGGQARQKMGTVAQYAMIYRAVQACNDKLSFYTKSAHSFSFYGKLASVFEEFSMYGVDRSVMEAALSDEAETLQTKYRDLLLLYNTYEALRTEKYRDAEDDMAQAIALLKENDWFVDAAVYIDGFYGFTPRQKELLLSIMMQARETVLTVVADDKDPLFSTIRKELFWLQNRLEKNGFSVRCRMIDGVHARGNNFDVLERHLFDYTMPEQKLSADEAVRVREHKDRKEEISFVAAEIRHKVLTSGLRYRDIAILCADLNGYEQLLDAVFSSQQIPFFMDKRTDLMAKPLISHILYALDIAEYNFRFDDVFSYAKTGLAGLEYDQASMLESYARLWGIQGKGWTGEGDWTKNPYGADREMDAAAVEKLKNLNLWRRTLCEPLKRLKRATEEGPAKSLLMGLWQFCVDISLEERLREMAQTCFAEDARGQGEMLRLYEIWIALLDELAEALGDTVIDRKTLQNILHVCLSEVHIGSVPPTMDQVTVGEVSRARLDGVKCIYLLGVNQGVLPSLPMRDSLITDADISVFEKHGITLSKESVDNAAEQRYRLYGTLCKATEGICFSFVRTDGENGQQLPSEYIERLRELIDFSTAETMSPDTFYLTHANAVLRYAAALPVGSAARKDWRAALCRNVGVDIDAFLPQKQNDRLSPEAVGALYSKNISMSQSRIQTFVDCPFKYFLEYGLSLQQDKEVAFDAASIGTFLHYGLEKFLDWGTQLTSPTDAAQVRQAVDDIVDGYLKNQMKDMDSAKVAFLAGRMREVLHLAVHSVTNELHNSQFAPKATELDISDKDLKLPLSNGFYAKLNGIIDRIDCGVVEGEPYFKIVDYKSGDKKFSLEKIYNGYDLQLPLYAYACSRLSEFEGARPAAMEYLHVGVPKFKLEKNIPPYNERGQLIREELHSQFYRSGIFHSDMQVLQAMEKGTDGKYTVRYTTKGVPRADALVTNDEGLRNLMRFAREKVCEIGNEIAGGEIEAKPFKVYHNSCEYCNFHPLCRFDYATHNYRVYTKKKDIDVSVMLQDKAEEKGEV